MQLLDLYEQLHVPPAPTGLFRRMAQGFDQRNDEYRRNGVAYLNMIFEPLTAKRYTRVTTTHPMQDFAARMRWLGDELYPQAGIIRVVLDNPSTHKPAALYATFPPAEARRILKKLEFHFTPQQGSGLNMAEIELSV